MSLEAQIESLKARLRESEARNDDLTAQLQDALGTWGAEVIRLKHSLRDAEMEKAVLVEALAAGEASDGYHTHKELYEYRMLYNAHAAHGWLTAGIPVVKSWKHSDGELCFGGGWFIVVATLSSGQVSNHYKEEHWDLFDVPGVDLPPVYDQHGPKDAANRLLTELANLHARAADIQEVLEAVSQFEKLHEVLEQYTSNGAQASTTTIVQQLIKTFRAYEGGEK